MVREKFNILTPPGLLSLSKVTQFYSNVGLPVQLIGMCTGKVDKKDQAFTSCLVS